MTGRVASYNVHRCVGRDGRHAPGRIAEIIREIDSDIVGLQEVESGDDTGAGLRSLAQIATETGLTAVAGPTLVLEDGDYGNALLTRFPILAERSHDLSLPRREPRGALDVELRVAGTSLRVVTTHLGLRGPERRAQVDRLLRALGPADGRPLIVLGDFNEWWPLGTTLRRLSARLGPSAAPLTFPTRRPLVALDRIWGHPAGLVTGVHAHDSPLARVASDHLPVAGVLTVT